jgi:hypothetical protein
MANRKLSRLWAALALILFTLPVYGCAGGQSLQQVVTTEYLLKTAGFQTWDVNMETSKRAALLNYLPKGTISTYIRDGVVLHAYPDENSNKIYVGDEAAYQKYLSLAQGKQMCQRVTGENNVQFWSCMDDYQQGGVK